MSKKVWIDAGHGGSASGAVAFGRMEKNDTLKFALELERQFKTQWVDTVITRTRDEFVSLTERTNLENKNRCDLAISCHRNAAGDSSANGLEIWLHNKAPQSYVNWAKDVVDNMRSTGIAIRAGQVSAGVYKGFTGSPNDNYYANSGTNSPSMLIELGFITSPKDNAIFDDKYKDMCAAIVKASCKFLGVAYNGTEQDKQPSKPTYTDEQYNELHKKYSALQVKYDVLKSAVDSFVVKVK